MAKAAAKKKTTGTAMEFPLISKSQRIRDYLKDHKGAKGGEIVEALKEFGIGIANVGNILYKKPSKKSGKSGSKSGKRFGRPAKTATRGHESDGIESAVIFIRASGGIDAARAQLNQLAALKGIL